MLQNTSKTLGFLKIMVHKTPPGGGGKPYLAHGLIICLNIGTPKIINFPFETNGKLMILEWKINDLRCPNT